MASSVHRNSAVSCGLLVHFCLARWGKGFTRVEGKRMGGYPSTALMMASSLHRKCAVRGLESRQALGCGLVVHFFLADKDMGSVKSSGRLGYKVGKSSLCLIQKRRPSEAARQHARFRLPGKRWFGRQPKLTGNGGIRNAKAKNYE